MANEILSANGLAAIKTQLGRALKGWGAASPTITYVRQTSETYDPTASNANTPTTDPQSLQVFSPETSRKPDGETAQAGMREWLCTVADFEAAYSSGVRPSTSDQITHDGVTYEVTSHGEDPIGGVLSIRTKRVGSS